MARRDWDRERLARVEAMLGEILRRVALERRDCLPLVVEAALDAHREVYEEQNHG